MSSSHFLGISFFGGSWVYQKYVEWVLVGCGTHHVFLGISCFWGSRVYQMYVVWVFIGCRIKFRIQQALPLEISVKTQGDMFKI